MEDREIDLRLREVFKRNAPSFDGLDLARLTRPAGLRPMSTAPRRGVLRPLAVGAAVLVVVAVLGVAVWQAVSHLGGHNPIVVITDAPTSTAPAGDLNSWIEDGVWELRVDRQARTADVKLPTDFLPETAYQPVDAGPTFRVVISDGGAKVSIEGDGGNYAARGTRASTADGRIWYDTDAFAGGRFVIWRTTAGLQAEETMYGSGLPILHSYRGKLVRAQPGTGSFDEFWNASVAAVNALGPTRATIIETRNEHAPGDGSTGQTTANGPMVTRVEELLDAPTGRAYQRVESFVDSETVVDGAERLTVVQNSLLSSMPPWSRYRYVSLQPPTGLPLPLWAGNAAGQEGYGVLLSAIDSRGTTSAKRVEELANGRKLLTWERQGDGWAGGFSLTLASNLLPDVIVIIGETEGEGGRTEYSTRIEYRFDTTVSFQNTDFDLQANPPDPGVDEITYELPLGNPRSQWADWGQCWLGPSVGEWSLTAAEHTVHRGNLQPADEFVSLLYARPPATDSSENIQVEVRPADGDMTSASRALAEQQVTAGRWIRRETTIADRLATVYSGPAEGLGGRVDTIYIFFPDAFIAIDLWNLADRQTVLDAVTETLPFTLDANGRPNYDENADDSFNAAYRRYWILVRDKYYGGGKLSIAYPDIDLFRAEGLTPEWFGLDIEDLPRVIDRLEAGAWPAYTMSLIVLLTKSDPGIRPSMGDQKQLRDWVQAFNGLKADAAAKVKLRDVKALGYLALPAVYDELQNGGDATLVGLLPELADGLSGADKKVTAGWNTGAWIQWFESRGEMLAALRSVNERDISVPWLK